MIEKIFCLILYFHIKLIYLTSFSWLLILDILPERTVIVIVIDS